jgi:hypothetical protein
MFTMASHPNTVVIRSLLLYTSAVVYNFFFLMTWSFLLLFADSTAEKRGFSAQPSKGGASRLVQNTDAHTKTQRGCRRAPKYEGMAKL